MSYFQGCQYVVPAAGYFSGCQYIVPAAGYFSGCQYVTQAAGYFEGCQYVVQAAGYFESCQYVVYSGCFPKTELVHTDFDNRTPIGAIKVGDKICSWDTVRNKPYRTAVIAIKEYTVNEIVCFNKTVCVSFSHPLMVMEKTENGLLVPKWEVAYDVNVGDCIVGSDGKCITIKSKSVHWHENGIDVLSLLTDCGTPYMVGGFVVRAENAIDDIAWAETPTTQKLLVA
jgi:hypothetical protein